MRSLLPLLLFAALLLPAATAAAQDATCPEIKPGVSIGPVRVGMPRADLDKLKLTIQPGFNENNLKVGALQVYLKDGVVEAVGADSGAVSCVTLHGKNQLKLDETPMEEIAARFTGLCGPHQFNTGATVIDCKNGLSILQHLGGKELRVERTPPDVQVTCDAWVMPASTSRTTAEADVLPNKRVCFQGRDFTADLTPDDIIPLSGKRHINTCERTTARGATTLSCHYDGVRLTFAGPKLTLARMEAIPLRK